jgi:hypothetical protein
MDSQAVCKIPHNISQDKERLYEEIIFLKQQINELMNGNLKQ